MISKNRRRAKTKQKQSNATADSHDFSQNGVSDSTLSKMNPKTLNIFTFLITKVSITLKSHPNKFSNAKHPFISYCLDCELVMNLKKKIQIKNAMLSCRRRKIPKSQSLPTKVRVHY